MSITGSELFLAGAARDDTNSARTIDGAPISFALKTTFTSIRIARVYSSTVGQPEQL